MKKFRSPLFYLFIIGGFSLLMYLIILKGEGLETAAVAEKAAEKAAAQAGLSNWEQFKLTIRENLGYKLSVLLLQIITIIVTARVFGFICRKIGQPSVIGEIAAGIFLGPSFVGWHFPEFAAFLFPDTAMDNLHIISQLGLVLFMFVVGMELDLNMLKNKANDAVVISHASIIFPFALGVGLAYFLYDTFSLPGINFLSFALFTGIAMSITAFPVLARIVQERGLTKTRLGAVAITCAAADDITAWCILAAVIAIVKAGSFASSLYTILMAVAYVLVMLKLVQPFLKKLGDIYSNREGLSKPVVAIFFITLLVSAFATEVIGIHALFGAFMAGVIMPSNLNFRNIFIEKVEDVAVVLLLPLFFVFTGLRTEIGLLNDISLWKICGLICLVAIVGKFVGSAVAAKFTGQPWRDSLILGALMNTRGLMELVVLNIGYDLGVLGPEMFAMMVIMALVTTCMTGPALDLINRFLPEKKTQVPQEVDQAGKYRILVPFGNPERGKNMLRLASSFVKKAPHSSAVTALHLSPSNEVHHYNVQEYEQEAFQPVKSEAGKLNMPVESLFKVSSEDIEKEITDTANSGNFDLMIIGVGRSIFEGTLLGKVLGFTTKIINPERLLDTLTGREKLFENTVFDERTRQIIKSSKVPVGIFIDKKPKDLKNVFLPIFSVSDSFLLVYAQKLIHHNESRVSILDASGVIRQHPEMKETIRSIEQTAPHHIALYNERKIDKEFLEQQDLMLISVESWKNAVETQSVWLSNTPSVLILKS